ncbi:unnamed protein product [Ascophyllum nodosum]
MAIFPSSGKTSKTSKKTTPRGSNILFNKHQSSQQHPELLQQHPRQGQEEQEKQQQQPQRLHNQQQLQQHQQQQRTPPQSSFSPVSLAPEKTSDNSPPLTRISMDGSKMSSTERGYEEKGCLLDQKPESMVAETLRMRGELEFTRLLRVDGRFEGDLITDKGSLVVGPKGEVIGDLKNMTEVYVEGIVRGNVSAHDVKIKNRGMLYGDIQCVCLTLDPTATVKGVADTATLKERALSEGNPARASACPTEVSTLSASPARKNDAPEAAAATAEETSSTMRRGRALEKTVPAHPPSS